MYESPINDSLRQENKTRDGLHPMWWQDPLLRLGVATSIALSVLCGVVWIVMAANSYTIQWWVAGSGGGESKGGIYTLTGTAGQPDAGEASKGGSYQIVGGFWADSSLGSGITPVPPTSTPSRTPTPTTNPNIDKPKQQIFLPLVER